MVTLVVLSCGASRGCRVAQEAKERPNFAEIIQVLRALLADEARRAPSTSPSDQARRARLHPASSGSGDVRQAQQVLHAALKMLQAAVLLLCNLRKGRVEGTRREARRRHGRVCHAVCTGRHRGGGSCGAHPAAVCACTHRTSEE